MLITLSYQSHYADDDTLLKAFGKVKDFQSVCGIIGGCRQRPINDRWSGRSACSGTPPGTVRGLSLSFPQRVHLIVAVHIWCLASLGSWRSGVLQAASG